MREGCANSAKSSKIANQLQALHESVHFLTLIFNAEAQHGPISVVCVKHPGCQIMMRMLGKAWMIDRLHMRIFSQSLSDQDGILVLSPYTHTHGFD